VIPFLKGQAASGKSTVLRLCRSFYERHDVGVLSNNIERKFGLSAFYDKYLFVAPEVKNDLQLEQAEFQSIVSGEDVQINIKYQKAASVEWQVPGILAGNEVPGWRDNAGSILRRIVIFDFAYSVVNADMELGKKLQQELPCVLRKCNKAYLEAVNDVGDRGVWQCLPEYFRGTQRELEMATNPLQNFLASDRVQLGPSLCAPFDVFKDEFTEYARQNNLGKLPRFTRDYFKPAFGRHNISMHGATLRGLAMVATAMGDEGSAALLSVDDL
jgi:hypothetical protein